MALGVSFGTLISLLVVALVCVLSTDAATLGQFCNATITCTGDPVVCSDTNTCVCGTNYQQNSAENTCVVGLSSQCPNPGSDKCLDPNAVCTNESTVFTCLCNSLYYNNEGTCVLKVALGGACPNGTTDACLDTNATCTGTCTCKSTHYNNNGKCEPKVALGGACPTGTTEACLDTNANCTGTCTCKSTHYNNNSKCNPKVALGGACPNGTTGACLDTNATCTGTCTCKSTHYSNNGKCEPKKSLGYTCSQQVIQCADTNAECVGSSGTGTCQCKTGFYDSNGESLDGMCVAKVELNSDCSHPSACVTNNAACINDKCSCQSGFYDSNGVTQGGLCNIKVGLGTSCPKPDACGTNDAVCSNPDGGGTCVCDNGYYDSNGNTAMGGDCSLKVGLGSACPQPDACSTTNAVCSNLNGGGTCVCGNDYYDSNGKITLGGSCSTKTALGEPCPQPDACQPQNSECGSGTVCVCSASYFDSNGVSNIGGSCSAKLGLGFSCTQIDACNDINANCNQGTCVCNTGYYDSNGSGTNGGICELKVGLGEGCPRPDACNTPNSLCSNNNGGGTCICSSVYYDDNGDILGGSCLQKVQIGSPCKMSTACATANSDCVGATCQCSSGYYDDTGANLGGNCQYRLILNNQCDNFTINNYSQRDQCQDGNAECYFNSSYGAYSCTCKGGYHPEGSTCVADKPLGGSCTYKTDCSDPNADCIGSKCTCGFSHYDSNGRADGGNCMQLSDLQVTGITFPSVTMSSIKVMWTLPSASTFINALVVAWRPSSGTGQTVSETLSSPTETSYTISSQIEPGRAYRISIISKNTETDLTSARETESISYQAAKPNKPGPLQHIDLDASDRMITLGWPPVSYFSRFVVSLQDGSDVFVTDYPNTISWTLSHNTLLNGHRYNVTLVTRSEVYTSGNNPNAFISSETYLESIKTTVKIPGPPESPECMTDDFYSILLKWSPPTLSNGDLVQYHIEVYEKDKPVNAVANYRTGNTSTAYTVTGLKTGFNYFFKVTTENEMYNSTSVEANNCKTIAGRSGEPTNLTVTGVTSRSMNVAWSYPERTNSEEILGYILQIKDTSSSCVHEQLFKCEGCIESFQDPVGVLCPENVRQANISVEKQQLKERRVYTVTGLLPDIEYTISVSAVNPDGQGNISFIVHRTDEEEPQMPTDVSATDILEKSMIVIWKLQGPRPGLTKFTVTLTADAPASSPNKTVEGFDKKHVVMDKLEENWTYSVSVTAFTSKGSKIAHSAAKYTTKPAAPGPVDKFTVVTPGLNYTALQVKWMIPPILERNSIITGYVFVQNVTGTENSEDIHLESEAHIYEKYMSVVPEVYYLFKVFAKNQEGKNGTESTITMQAPAGVPYNQYETESTRVIPSAPAVSKTTVTIVIKRDFLYQTRNGQIRLTGLIGCEYSKCNISGSNMSKSAFEKMLNYSEASKKGFIPYRITKDDWETSGNLRQRRAVTDEITYTVGTESCKADASTYCNGPLPPDTLFSIIVVTCTNGGCLLSELYGPFRTEKEPDELPISAIIGGVVGGVAALLIICIIIGVLMYRRRNQGPSKMTKIVEDPMQKVSSTDDSNIARKRPVKLTEFEAHLKEMHKDTNLQFSAAYEDLKAISPRHSQNAANEEDNKMKNRYINILPFDHSRVKLSASGEDNKEDYINANYLPGYRSPREYIGCQGPLPGTIDDFWRMVWEQNVSVVVMLTLCKEQQKIKCEQYWPDEVNDPKQFGDVVVEVTSYSSIKTYDFRVFKLVCNGRTRILKHFHFLTWLDFQANVQHEIILDFITQVRSHVQPPDTAGPMIIHCSAGVGRTGTYIVLDHLMQYIDDHDFEVNIDIFDMVMKLRENRPHMVQTEQQFVFIHDCVKVLLDKKRIALAEQNNIYENRAFDTKEDNIYQNQQELTYENVQMKTEL